MKYIDIQRVRHIHKQRMKLYNISISRDYEDEIIDRILDRNNPEPETHSHWFHEMGMCVERDAACALGEYNKNN